MWIARGNCQSASNSKNTVPTAAGELFGSKDPSAVDRWVAADYIQHSALAADGPEALRRLVAGLPEDFRYVSARVLADGDLVVLHGTYHGFGPDPLVGFDIFRVDGDGKLAEHWDALTPVVADTASGRTQTDGPAEVTEPDKTEANRALVGEFAQRVLVGADYSVLTNYISTATYAQHNPEAADGLDGFAAAAHWAEQGKNLAYKTVHKVIAEVDGGLTEFGREVVAEMNRVGMVVDAAHCSYRTSMGVFAASAAPVVLSHTAARAVHDHVRNVWDDQMLACAATGGVVGINGVGIFLGANDASTEALVRHLDHAVELVGWEHVGLGLDFCFGGVDAELAETPDLFPPSYTQWDRVEFIEPERLPAITAALVDRGYAPEAVEGILGGNFLRVAENVWL
ncbi:membrane dipeptidase [Kribbella sp. NPDC050470]|uniref:membrane dipeptidase n=1 Tax=unclassified Kribbella TaxID=2644121 RepID=UPI00379F71A0